MVAIPLFALTYTCTALQAAGLAEQGERNIRVGNARPHPLLLWLAGHDAWDEAEVQPTLRQLEEESATQSSTGLLPDFEPAVCPGSTYFIDWGSSGMKVKFVHSARSAGTQAPSDDYLPGTSKGFKLQGIRATTSPQTLASIFDGLARQSNATVASRVDSGGQIFATAGMRLQPMQSKKAWEVVRAAVSAYPTLFGECGNGTDDSDCRTLPGSVEARYEMTSMLKTLAGESFFAGDKQVGFASCGGASLQIGVRGSMEELEQCRRDLGNASEEKDRRRIDLKEVLGAPTLLVSFLADSHDGQKCNGTLCDYFVGGVDEMRAQFDNYLLSRGVNVTPCLSGLAVPKKEPACEAFYGVDSCTIDKYGGKISRLTPLPEPNLTEQQQMIRKSWCVGLVRDFLSHDLLLNRWGASVACTSLARNVSKWGLLTAFGRDTQLGADASAPVTFSEVRASSERDVNLETKDDVASGHVGLFLTSTLLVNLLAGLGVSGSATLKALSSEWSEEAMREANLRLGWLPATSCPLVQVNELSNGTLAKSASNAAAKNHTESHRTALRGAQRDSKQSTPDVAESRPHALRDNEEREDEIRSEFHDQSDHKSSADNHSKEKKAAQSKAAAPKPTDDHKQSVAEGHPTKSIVPALPRAVCEGSTFFIDWGSSGMKVKQVYKVGPEGKVPKHFMKGTTEGFKLKGIDAFTPPGTLKAVFDELAKAADAFGDSGRDRGGEVFATAGMRLEPKQAHKAWEAIRDASGAYPKLLGECGEGTDNDDCRTLPGSVEARHEMESMLMSASGKRFLGNSGRFGFASCGGASLQIGVRGPLEELRQCRDDLGNVSAKKDLRRIDLRDVAGKPTLLVSFLSDSHDGKLDCSGEHCDYLVGGVNEMRAQFDNYLVASNYTGNPCLSSIVELQEHEECQSFYGTDKCTVDAYGGLITRLRPVKSKISDGAELKKFCISMVRDFLARDLLLSRWAHSQACSSLAQKASKWGLLSAFGRSSQFGVDAAKPISFSAARSISVKDVSLESQDDVKKGHVGMFMTSSMLVNFLYTLGLADDAKLLALKAEWSEEALRQAGLAMGWPRADSCPATENEPSNSSASPTASTVHSMPAANNTGPIAVAVPAAETVTKDSAPLTPSIPEFLPAVCSGSTYFIDWGSSGMKVSQVYKIGSAGRMPDEFVEGSRKGFKIKGVSAFSPPSAIRDVLTSLADRANVTVKSKTESGGEIFATAGMRLKPTEAHQAWEVIRNASGAHPTLLGDCGDGTENLDCRTLPGSTEARYEMTSMLHSSEGAELTRGVDRFGFASCGGASLQIGLRGPKAELEKCRDDLGIVSAAKDRRRIDFHDVLGTPALLVSFLSDSHERHSCQGLGGSCDYYVGGVDEMRAQFDNFLTKEGHNATACVSEFVVPKKDAACQSFYGTENCTMDKYGGKITRLPPLQGLTDNLERKKLCTAMVREFLSKDLLLSRWRTSLSCMKLSGAAVKWGLLTAFSRKTQLGVDVSSAKTFEDVRFFANENVEMESPDDVEHGHPGLFLTSALLIHFLAALGVSDFAEMRAIDTQWSEEAVRASGFVMGWPRADYCSNSSMQFPTAAEPPQLTAFERGVLVDGWRMGLMWDGLESLGGLLLVVLPVMMACRWAGEADETHAPSERPVANQSNQRGGSRGGVDLSAVE